jgi:hypothetical protein
MSLKHRVLKAILACVALSVAFLLLFLVSNNALVYWPQWIGIKLMYLTLLLRGVSVQSSSDIDFVVVVIPTNALIYASIIFGVSSLVTQRKTRA